MLQITARPWQVVAMLPNGRIAVRDRDGRLTTLTPGELAQVACTQEVLTAHARRLSADDVAAGKIL